MSAEQSFYRDKLKTVTAGILKKIRELSEQLDTVSIMHVCGTHEATVSRSGIRGVIPPNIRIIAGPGCPVCVCPAEHITTAKLLAEKGYIITTFGDMLKVPDSDLRSLMHVKADGHDVRVVYSVREAVKIARNNPDKDVVWLGVGFETTAPMTAHELIKGVPSNFYVLADFRLVPPALDLLLSDGTHGLQGIILPGHVSTIVGSASYRDLPKKYSLPMTIAGFEPVEFLYALEQLLEMIVDGRTELFNAYSKVVREEGNLRAQEEMQQVFKVVDAKWRGIGVVEKSGLDLRDEFSQHNARLLLDPVEITYDLPRGCRCGEVILGKVEPEKCPHFLRRCTPETAIGPCMVSDEGTCRIRAVYSGGA